jgi:cytoskeletal protein CcmA (bactofilin family)
MSIEPPRRPATPISNQPIPASTVAPVTESPRDLSNQMLVGREVALSGKITGCDRLLVEGKVEATLLECSAIEVAGPGVFNGTATVDHAEISGRFEGTLTVRKRLLIRASGQVSGTIRYGQLEVECGGKLAGDIGSEG